MSPILLAALLLSAAAIVAYLLGSIDFGVLVSRLLYHEDVRTKGSGNAGATNMLRTYGKGAAALTLLGDLGKGVAAVLLGRLIFGLCAAIPADAIYGGYVAAIAALCGHLWPVWFGFKGGKGVAVAAGALLATEPTVFLVLAVVFFTLFAISRMVSLCSVTVAALYPLLTALFSWYKGRNVWFTTICALIMGGVIIWMHRANLRRIKEGTEYRFGSKK